MSTEAFLPNSHYYNEKVDEEIFRLRVRKKAQTSFEIEQAGSVEIPTGVLADDPLPPEPPELIPGILLRHGATGIIGAKETGKSLVALEIQHCLLTGEPLWGSILPTSVVEKTVHVLAEHASPVLQGLYQRTELSKTGRLHIYGPEHLQSMKLLVSNGVRREDSISFYKKLVAGAGLVVFDPLASFIQGEVSENDNTSMRSVIDSMIEICASTGAACLVLGHQGKPQFFQGKVMKRQSYGARGASATEDSLTAVHYLDREAGMIVDGKPVFELRPVHYKGYKAKPYHILRDPKTMRHTYKPGI